MKQRSRLKDMGSYVIKWACTIYCNMFIIYYIPSKSHFVDIARAHCSLLFRSRNNDILYSIPIYTYIYIYANIIPCVHGSYVYFMIIICS